MAAIRVYSAGLERRHPPLPRGLKNSPAGRFGPLLLALGQGFRPHPAQSEGQTLTLIAGTFLLFGAGLTAGWLLQRTRSCGQFCASGSIHSVIGLGLLALWAVPWTTITGLQAALQPEPGLAAGLLCP